MKKMKVKQQVGGGFLVGVLQNLIQGALASYVLGLFSLTLGCSVFILFVVWLCLQKHWQNSAWIVLKDIDDEDVRKRIMIKAKFQFCGVLNAMACNVFVQRLAHGFDSYDRFVSSFSNARVLVGLRSFCLYLHSIKGRKVDVLGRIGNDSRTNRNREYSLAMKEYLSSRFQNKIQQFKSRLEESIEVLVVGGDDVELQGRLLCALSAEFADVGVDILHMSERSENLLHVELMRHQIKNVHLTRLNDETQISAIYHVVFAHHYFQHVAQRITGDFFALKPFRRPSLLVWISAVSRDKKRSEYVCQGFSPRVVSSQEFSDKDDEFPKSYMLNVSEMGVFGATTRTLFYRKSLKNNSLTIASLDFPRSAVVPGQGTLKGDNLCRIVKIWIEAMCKSCGKIGKLHSGVERNREIDLLRKVSDVMVTEVAPNDNRIFCDAGNQIQYRIVRVSYSIPRGDRLEVQSADFICAIGSEKEDESVGNDTGIHVRLHLAVRKRMSIGGLPDEKRRQAKECVRTFLESDGVCRPLPYDDADIMINDTSSVVKVLTEASNISQNNLIFVKGDDACYYCAYLPSRRYLGVDDAAVFNMYTDKIFWYKRQNEIVKADTNGRVCPFLPGTCVTAQFSYAKIMNLIGEDFRVVDPENDVFFFYVLNYAKTDRDVRRDARFENVQGFWDGIAGVEEGRERVKKDIAINTLKLEDRFSVLGLFNVQNVMLFAERKDVGFMPWLDRWLNRVHEMARRKVYGIA